MQIRCRIITTCAYILAPVRMVTLVTGRVEESAGDRKTAGTTSTRGAAR